MKKISYLLPVAALVFGSCSNDETISQAGDNAIQFRTLMQNPTRGTTVDVSSLGSFHITSSGSGIKGGTHMNDDVTSNDNGTSWNMTNKYYWADSGTENFTAYAPADKFSVSGGTASIQVTEKVAEQKDLVVAYQSSGKTTNAVPLNFKHILSQVEILASCHDATRKVEVVGVKFSNVNNTRTFTMPTTETTGSTDINSCWTGSAGTTHTYAANRANTSADPITLTSSAQSLMFSNGPMLLIPQTVSAATDLSSTSATGTYISVLCRISDVTDASNPTAIFPTTSGEFAYTAVPVDIDWQAGKKYTYTLKFYYNGGGAGQKDPSQDDPNNEEDDNISDEEGGGGQEIEAPIKFSVSVDSWGDASNTDKQI